MDKQQAAWISLGLLLTLGGGLYWWLNRGYGEVSQQGYEISMSLFSVCNRKDASRLGTIEELVKKMLAAGELRSDEGDWFLSIIDQAKQGSWQAAAAACRRLMDDQVKPAPELPNLD